MDEKIENVTPQIDFQKELAGLNDFSGQIAYLPGGYGGLGEAIAWGLAMRGAKVVISGRDEIKAQKLANEISAAGFAASGLQCDATKVDSIKKSTDAVVDTYGGLNLLVNCVGIQIEEPLLEVKEKSFDQVYETNLKSAMFLAQASARHQVDQGQGGRQIHLLSVRSKLGIRGRGYSAYCSTKGGMAMLIKQHAVELAEHKITVNGVAPTFVYTELIRYIVEDPEYHEKLVSRIPMGRIADPKDVVGAALYFLSPAASFVTGQILYVDGGITATQ